MKWLTINLIIRQEESLGWINLLELQNRVIIQKIIGKYMAWCTTNLVRYFLMFYYQLFTLQYKLTIL